MAAAIIGSFASVGSVTTSGRDIPLDRTASASSPLVPDVAFSGEGQGFAGEVAGRGVGAGRVGLDQVLAAEDAEDGRHRRGLGRGFPRRLDDASRVVSCALVRYGATDEGRRAMDSDSPGRSRPFPPLSLSAPSTR